MLKKYLFLMLAPLIVIFFLTAASNSYALSAGSNADSVSYPYQSNPTQSFFGQNNYYSVFLRGNGEAVVSFKAQFTNTEDSPFSVVRYTIPASITINNVIVYQLTSQTPPCNYPMYDLQGNISPVPSTEVSAPVVSQNIISRPCNYFDSSYRYGNTYKKAIYQIQGDRLVITLPNPIQPNQQVNFLLSYRSFDFTNKDLIGVYSYEFKTLKSNQTIDSMQVGIFAEQDFVLKDTAKGQVNYAKQAASALMPAVSETAAAFSNQQLDSFYNQIGQGTIYKYASNLAPNESYSVKGAYADSALKLYIRQIVISMIIIILLIVFIIWVIKKLVKLINNKSVAVKIPFQYQVALISLGTSFIGAFFVMAYTVFLFIFFGLILPQLPYLYNYKPFVVVFILLISLVVYGLLLFVPCLFLAVKRSLGWGIATFVFTIIWLLIYITILFVFIFIIATQQRTYPVPMMGNSGAIENSQTQQK
jgi:hypothetical protein